MIVVSHYQKCVTFTEILLTCWCQILGDVSGDVPWLKFGSRKFGVKTLQECRELVPMEVDGQD
jgi:hypothetical protein